MQSRKSFLHWAGLLPLGICISITVLSSLAAPLPVTTVVAVSGDVPSRGAGVVFLLDTPVINDSGHAVFQSTRYTTNGFIVGGGTFRGNGQSNPRSLDVIVLQDDPAPDANGYFATGRGNGHHVNDQGEVALATSLEGTLGGNQDNSGIYRGNGAALTQIARANQTVPDGPGRMLPYFVYPVSMNNSGHVAFISWLYNPTADAIYRSDGANLTKVVRTGDSAPGGGTFSSLQYRCSINDAGQVFFVGIVNPGTGGSVGGFWRRDGEAITEIARDGNPTPSNNGTLTLLQNVNASFNNAGKVAFYVTMFDSELGAADNAAIIYGDENSKVEIVRKGDFVPGQNGRFLDFSSASRGLALNNHGQVLFVSTISAATNGSTSGIFLGHGSAVTTIARVNDPAPGGGRFSGFNAPRYALNSSGQGAFYATIDLENGGSTNDRFGLFFYDPVLGLLSVALQGDQLGTFGQISALQFEGGLGIQGDETSGLNDRGQVAFQCTVSGNHAIAIWSLPEKVSLSINRDVAAGTVVLSWPTNASGFTLQFKTNLADTLWSAVSPTPTAVGSNYVVTNSTTGQAKFYQLRQP